MKVDCTGLSCFIVVIAQGFLASLLQWYRAFLHRCCGLVSPVNALNAVYDVCGAHGHGFPHNVKPALP